MELSTYIYVTIYIISENFCNGNYQFLCESEYPIPPAGYSNKIKKQDPLLELLPLHFRLIIHRIALLYEQGTDPVYIG